MGIIWKTLAAPLIVAIVSSLLVGLFLGRAQAPETPVITASIQWVDAQNPFSILGYKGADDAGKFANTIWPGTDLSTFLSQFRFRKEVRIIDLQLNNTSDLRSKEIEISAGVPSGWVSSESDGSNKPLSPKMKIKSIDPNSSVRVIGLAETWSTFSSPPFLILHNGKRVDPQLRVLTEDPVGFVALFQNYPLLSGMFGMLSAVVTLFIVIAVPVSLVAAYNFKFKAKLTSKEELAKTIEFVEFMKKNHPKNFSSIAY